MPENSDAWSWPTGARFFLDEIGDVPLNLQPKLLRVLQDMEFERLGGTQTLKVNFRLLAATNRDLLQSVGRTSFAATCITA